MTWKIIKTKKKLLIDEFTIKPVDKSEYSKLKRFHYINQNQPSGHRKTFGLFYKDSDILYGIVVYTTPILELKARRNTPLRKILSLYKNQSARYSKLNSICTCISRIIIHPSIRGIGSSAKLVEDSWRQAGTRFVDCMATMLYYRNFLPDSYSYFIRVENSLTSQKFFDKQGNKGIMEKRVKTPVLRYGYALYINEEIMIQ